MALKKPTVSWWLPTNGENEQVSKWDIDVVDASTTSKTFTFMIWNNRKGTEDAPDMQNAVIMTKDANQDHTGELVEGQWIEVRIEQVDTQFNKIGWDVLTNKEVSRPVKTLLSTTFNGVTSTPNVAPHTTTIGEVSLLGVINDGTLENAKGNYTKIQMQCRVPGNASAGLIKFLTRVTYQHQ